MSMLTIKIRTNLLPFLLLVFLLDSCAEPKAITEITISTNVDLVVRNGAGKNLLDAATPGYYKPEDIRIYNRQNGVRIEVFNPNMDAPRNFRIFKNEGNNEYFMRVFPNEGTLDQEQTITYIQWRTNKEDTLQTLISRPTPAVTTTNKVWYNGVLKSDMATSTGVVDWGNGRFVRLIEVTH